MEEVIQQWRKIQNDELNDLYCSPNIVRVIKSRRIRWAGHVWGRRGVYTGFWWGNLRERDYLRGPGVEGSIILRWLFRKWDVRVWTCCIWPRIETGGGRL